MIARTVQPPVPIRVTPQTTYHTDQLKLSTFYHGDGIQVFSCPRRTPTATAWCTSATTTCIATGDVFETTSYPVIDLERGGSINGVVDALNQILDIAFPDFRLEGGTLIVPGHGRLCDSADVAYYRDMVTIVRDRVQDMVKKGMTLDQVKAAKATRDYDPLRIDIGAWTPDMFVEPRTRASASGNREPARAVIRRAGLSAASARPWKGRATVSCCCAGSAAAQRRAADARAAAPVDLTGYWVQRRHRRLALSDGDAGEGRSSERAAQCRRVTRWRTAGIRRRTKPAGDQCKAYGAAGVMRAPGRLHITWQDDTTLKIETEAGTQTRLLRFGPAGAPASGTPALAGRIGRAVGIRRRRAAAAGGGSPAQGRQPEGRDDADAARISAEERRALRWRTPS